MAGTVLVQVIPTAYTLLGSGPMLIRTPAAIGITGQAGTATPGATTAYMGLSGNDQPFNFPLAENVFAIALQQTQPGQPAVSIGVAVTT